MAVKSREIKRITIILILIILVIVNIMIYLESKSLNDKYKNYSEEYLNLKKENKEINKQLFNLNNELDTIKNIEQKIKNIEKEYFGNIKILEDKILNNQSKQKIAYLTFDDGPYYNTYKILDILDQYDVKATFFTTNINGETCYDNKQANCHLMYQEYLKRGHTIANHTYSHGIKRGLYNSEKTFIDSVKKQEDLINSQTGYITNIVRFPGGSATAGKLKNSIIEELRKNNYGWVDWTAQDGDGGSLSSKEQAWQTFTNSIDSNIEVILLHDYNGITTSILPDIIQYLKDNNYLLLPLFYESNMVNK